ncbi:MAG: hypothetical protein AAF391_02425 [Bacteroidota bacterium]
MKNYPIYLFLTLLLNFTSCTSERSSNEWHIVLKTNKDGTIINGSKEKLISALRSGADLKLGWGWKHEGKTLEHIAFPTWIGIINEQEVYAYLDPQVLSRLDWGNMKAHYEDSTLSKNEWRVAINTEGTFDAIWIDRDSNEITRRAPQNHIMTWWVSYEGKSDTNALFMNQ